MEVAQFFFLCAWKRSLVGHTDVCKTAGDRCWAGKKLWARTWPLMQLRCCRMRVVGASSVLSSMQAPRVFWSSECVWSWSQKRVQIPVLKLLHL
jgi:hypothetical protein